MIERANSNDDQQVTADDFYNIPIMQCIHHDQEDISLIFPSL